MKKDIILILDGGGTMGIFESGVLMALDSHIRDRVHSIYATSAGADTGVYYISNQIDRTHHFFKVYLTGKDFINHHFLKYLLDVIVLKRGKVSEIKSIIDLDYVASRTKNKSYGLNLGEVKNSKMHFYVKVVDVDSAQVKYLKANDNTIEKLRATSTGGPFTTKAIEIDKKSYIDGGVLNSDIDLDIIKKNPDKKIIFIQPIKKNRMILYLLYPLYLIIAYLMLILYNKTVTKIFLKSLFYNPLKKIKNCENVEVVESNYGYSMLTIDKEKLEKVYRDGYRKGKELLKKGI